MAFSVEIRKLNSDENTLAGAIADAFAARNGTAHLGKTLKLFQAARQSALGMTAGRLRKRMKEAFETNALNWKQFENTAYSHWFGKFGEVSIKGLIKANKPIGMFTGKGNWRRTAGYSRKGRIKPPLLTKYPVGGRYADLMRYMLEDDNFKVGLMYNVGSKWVRNFQKFQEGGSVVHPGYGTLESMRSYFGALGMPLRKYPLFKMPRRPLISKIERLYPPDALFKEAYLEKLNDPD